MTNKKDLIFSVIGIVIMLLGFVLPPVGIITEVGIQILCIFIGTLFLWSTINSPWVSLLAIAMVGITGYKGGFEAAFTASLGDSNVILIILAFILFGGGLVGSNAIPYITRWILTRKFVAGKPYLILTMVGLCAYLLAFLTNQMISALIMIGVVAELCKAVGIEHGKDKIWIYLFGMIFLGAGIGQPGFVYKGIGLMMINAFTMMTGGAATISAIGYMLYNIVMSMILIALFLLLIKFLFRPDVSKLQNATVEKIEQASALPPIGTVQKAYLGMTALFLLMVILPNLGSLGALPGLNILKTVGAIGVIVFWIVIFSIVKVEGKPLLNFKKAASDGIAWNVVLMVAVGLMLGTAMGDTALGIIPTIKQFVSPLLVGKPTLVVVFIVYLAALIITNFAVNVAMAVAMMPIVIACATQLGLNPAPMALGVMMVCFIAMCTPAASPLASYVYGEDRYYTPKEIRSYALLLSILSVFIFTFIGYPLAGIMVGI